jgi:hypothetical protein
MRTDLSIILALGLLGACFTTPGMLEGDADEADDTTESSESESSESDSESSESDGESSESNGESSSDTELENPCAACQEGELCVGDVLDDVCNLDFGFTISCIPAPDTCTDDLCDPACVEALCGEDHECVPECNGEPVDLWCGVNNFSGICDPLAQNCPEGEKCTPIIEGDGNAWNANICVPVVGNAQPGDPCVLEDDWTDDCAQGSFCWPLSEDVGFCQLLCDGDATAKSV